MYIIYSGTDNRYATAAVSTRHGAKTKTDYLYLGKVLDRQAGIYKSRERGIFKFDLATQAFGPAPEEYLTESTNEKKEEKVFSRVSVDFGDSFFLNEFLYKSGMMSIVDKLKCKNKETLHAMILFYVLSSMANCDAIYWYRGNIVHLLYPDANISSQRISEFLSDIGSDENRMRFQIEYINFITKYYDNDKNILIDSTGLPNSINFRFTRKNIHNGKLSNEIRLIFVVQKSTGLPLFYFVVPGNVVDVNTLETIFLHLEAMKIDIESCILDAGFNSNDNYELFYDLSTHQKKIGFIIRIKSNFKPFKELIQEEIETLEDKNNLVCYEDRYLFIVKKQIMIGSEGNNSAYLYLGLDLSRKNEEYKSLVKRAKAKNMTNDAIFDALQSEGFFGILSNLDIACEDILPAYYQRQAAEQIFDFAKNYTKLLPLRTYTEETFQGHLLISYIATCVVKMIQLRLQVANLFCASRLVYMRNQKCTIYKNFILPDIATKEVNDVYKCFNIYYPKKIVFEDNKIKYKPPEIDIDSILPRSQKNSKNATSSPASDDGNNATEGSVPKKKSSTFSDKVAQTKVENTSNDDSKDNLPKDSQSMRRGRGRPKGSKNKKTLAREAEQAAERSESESVQKPSES